MIMSRFALAIAMIAAGIVGIAVYIALMRLGASCC